MMAALSTGWGGEQAHLEEELITNTAGLQGTMSYLLLEGAKSTPQAGLLPGIMPPRDRSRRLCESRPDTSLQAQMLISSTLLMFAKCW